jgi:putative FmdB family regulatory protein
MAYYEYKCHDCDTMTTVNRGMTEDDPGYTCETCNSALTRVYSKVGVSFKGSGFYSTDK